MFFGIHPRQDFFFIIYGDEKSVLTMRYKFQKSGNHRIHHMQRNRAERGGNKAEATRREKCHLLHAYNKQYPGISPTGALPKYVNFALYHQRCGSPRGYMIWNFSGSDYTELFKATSLPFSAQISVPFLTPSFTQWYDQMWSWVNTDPQIHPETPPVTLNDLPDQSRINKSDLHTVRLIANVWNGSKDSKVFACFDNKDKIVMQRSLESHDPYALRLQSYVMRYAMGFTLFNGTLYSPAAPQPVDPWLHANP